MTGSAGRLHDAVTGSESPRAEGFERLQRRDFNVTKAGII